MKNEITMLERDFIEILHAKSGQSLPLHSHECFVFGVILGGEPLIEIDGKKKSMRRGESFFVPANVGVEIIAGGNYEYISVCMKGRLSEMLALYEYGDFFQKIPDLRQFEEYCSRFSNGGNWEDLFFGIYPFIRKCQEISVNHNLKETNPSVQLAKEFIREHVMEEFDLDALCRHVGMSKFHFIRLFKKETGVPPNQYYIQAKLYVVKQRIKNNEKFTDVAADLNFSDQSHMANLFKKRMGISMKDFQKNFHKD